MQRRIQIVHASNKIIAAIVSCKTMDQLFSCLNMIENFGRMFPEDKEQYPFGVCKYEGLKSFYKTQAEKINGKVHKE